MWFHTTLKFFKIIHFILTCYHGLMYGRAQGVVGYLVHFTANLSLSLRLKGFLKSVKILHSYRNEFGIFLFWAQCR